MGLDFDIESALDNNRLFCLGCGALYEDGKKLWQHFCQTHCTAEELRDFGSTMRLLAQSSGSNDRKPREGDAKENDVKKGDQQAPGK